MPLVRYRKVVILGYRSVGEWRSPGGRRGGWLAGEGARGEELLGGGGEGAARGLGRRLRGASSGRWRRGEPRKTRPAKGTWKDVRFGGTKCGGVQMEEPWGGSGAWCGGGGEGGWRLRGNRWGGREAGGGSARGARSSGRARMEARAASRSASRWSPGEECGSVGQRASPGIARLPGHQGVREALPPETPGREGPPRSIRCLCTCVWLAYFGRSWDAAFQGLAGGKDTAAAWAGVIDSWDGPCSLILFEWPPCLGSGRAPSPHCEFPTCALPGLKGRAF